MIDPALEREALALFEASLREPEATRDAWIAARAGDRPELLSRVRAIAEGDRLAALATGAALHDVEPEPPLPERIGAYRIVERIGRGGMGSVYRGERALGDFDHVVAIKVIKPGLLGEALIARFRREREILAKLRHPGIAQLYDGGETEGGAPFIVMEYVAGEPLLDWAREAAPSRAERLRVFAAMCDAVAFAHRNLIVHRDLTPSNVLVTGGSDRDWGVKLIDFGIAKPADILADKGTPTSRASVVSLSLTPGYAAPERMSGAPVTTAADVYSLGRLLDRLIPPGPRDRELRAIVEQATAEAPGDRYATADSLADDIARLRDGRPVTAVGGGKRYRTARFIARYRVATGAAALALVALIAGLGFSLHAYSRAESARAAEAARFAELRSLANYLLFDLNDRLQRTIGNTAAREDLAREAQKYLSSLAHSPHADPRVRFDAATGLIKLARIQGVPSEPNLGKRQLARVNLERAEQLLIGLRTAPSIESAPALAEAQALQSTLAIHTGKEPDRAKAYLRKAQATLATQGSRPTDAAWAQARRAVRRAELDDADLGERAAELPALADAMEADIARWPPAMRNSFEERYDRAYAAYYRALARMMRPDAKGSVPLFLETERRFDALLRERPNDPPVLYMSAFNAMIGFEAASKSEQPAIASRLIESARTNVDRLARLDPNDDAVYALANNIREGLSQDLSDNRRFAEAIQLQREVIATRRRDLAGRLSGTLGFSLAVLGIIGKEAGDRTLACDSWKEAEAVLDTLRRRKELVEYIAAFLPGLRANLKLCAAGEPVAGFKPLR